MIACVAAAHPRAIRKLLPRLAPALISLVLSLSSSARLAAQDSATAEALFDQGRALMAKREYADACSKFEASQRLEPAIGTLLNLATCLEQLGKTASAWIAYREAASLATWQKQPEREAFARAQAAALESRIARLTVIVAEPAPDDLVVSRAGSPIPRDAWGSGIPVDPGEWLIAAEAAGRQPFATHVAVQPGATAQVLVPVLDPLPEPAPAPEPPVIEPAVAVPASRPPAVDAADARAVASEPAGERDDRSTWTALGLGVGGAGLIGLGVGGYFALRMLDEDGDSRAICADPEADCSRDQIDERDGHLASARAHRTRAQVSAAIGGACLIGGVVLFLIGQGKAASDPRARHDDGVSLHAAETGIGLRVRARFR
jgi:hypothetical protein